jgi:Family of unknown function (DUF6491)
MKSPIRWIFAWLAPAVLVACATHHPNAVTPPQTVTPQMRSGSSELRAYQLIDWIAPDDRTLLVNSVDRSLFRGRFKGPCTGLRHVDTIAFIVQTPLQVDKYAGVVLPNGTRCEFASLTRLDTTPPARDKEGAPATDSP